MLFACLVLLNVLALVRFWRRGNAGKPHLLAAAVVGVFLLSWPPLSWVAAQTLEARYPARPFPEAAAEAIVVLSGTVYPPTRQRPRALIAESTYIRCEHAAWLYKNWRPVPVLACGGLGLAKRGSQRALPKIPPALAMREALQQLGVAPSMIWVEDRSGSTYESAVNAAAILRDKGIRSVALVTEAHHMLRAEKCFRAQGLNVSPAPCNFVGLNFSVSGFLPEASTIAENGLLLHEWLGLAWYSVRGRFKQ